MNIICTAVIFVFSQVCQNQPYDNLPIMATAYNWNHLGLNCNEDCTTLATGINTSDELLGKVAACPFVWVRLDRPAVITIDGRDYWCLDNFGHERNRKPVYMDGQWYIRVDLALHDPIEFGVRVYEDWGIRWEWVGNLN